MKKILVHAHIYYEDMWEEIKACLDNLINEEYDLYVTLSNNSSILKCDIKKFKSNSEIFIVENRGYDVAPFVHVLNMVDLSKYDYIVKIHTKRNMMERLFLNHYEMSGPLWRDSALSFIRTRENFNKCLSAFEKYEALGMIANHKLIYSGFWGKKTDEDRCRNLLMKMNFIVPEIKFVAGTMFISRAKLFIPIQKMGITISDFEKSDRNTQSSLAHVIERIFGCVIIAQGFRIDDHFTNRSIKNKEIILSLLHRLCCFLYSSKITNNKIKIIKILKIPVFYKKVK